MSRELGISRALAIPARVTAMLLLLIWSNDIEWQAKEATIRAVSALEDIFSVTNHALRKLIALLMDVVVDFSHSHDIDESSLRQTVNQRAPNRQWKKSETQSGRFSKPGEALFAKNSIKDAFLDETYGSEYGAIFSPKLTEESFAKLVQILKCFYHLKTRINIYSENLHQPCTPCPHHTTSWSYRLRPLFEAFPLCQINRRTLPGRRPTFSLGSRILHPSPLWNPQKWHSGTPYCNRQSCICWRKVCFRQLSPDNRVGRYVFGKYQAKLTLVCGPFWYQTHVVSW